MRGGVLESVEGQVGLHADVEELAAHVAVHSVHQLVRAAAMFRPYLGEDALQLNGGATLTGKEGRVEQRPSCRFLYRIPWT